MRLTAEWTRLECQRAMAVPRWPWLCSWRVVDRDGADGRGRGAPRAERARPAVGPPAPGNRHGAAEPAGLRLDPIRALPEVGALTTFAVAKFALDGYPVATQNNGLPPGDSQVFRTIERPVVLQGRLLDPGPGWTRWMSAALFPGNSGKGVGDTLTLHLPGLKQGRCWGPSSGLPPRGPKIRVRVEWG